MTDKEFKNRIIGAIEKCFNTMAEYEPYSEQFTKSLENLNRLYMWRPGSLFEDNPYDLSKKKEKEVEEPYVEEPPHDTEWVKDTPEETATVETVDLKQLRVDLQKALSAAKREHGIDPKELVGKYATNFKQVPDADLLKLQADLNEALANA